MRLLKKQQQNVSKTESQETKRAAVCLSFHSHLAAGLQMYTCLEKFPGMNVRTVSPDNHDSV